MRTKPKQSLKGKEMLHNLVAQSQDYGASM